MPKGLALKFRELASDIPVLAFRSACAEIRDYAGLGYTFYMGEAWQYKLYKKTGLAKFRARRIFQTNLVDNPDLVYLLLFDGNGYNRELALRSISGPLKSAFEVIALADLANNWVPEVRKVALEAIERSYPLTDPIHLAKASSFVLQNLPYWKRLNLEERDRLKAYFLADRVCKVFVELLLADQISSPTKALGNFVRSPIFDRYVQRLIAAPDIGVRACALDMLLKQKVTWSEGFKFEWVDNQSGNANAFVI